MTAPRADETRAAPRPPAVAANLRDYRLVLAARAVSAFGTAFGPVALAFGFLALPSAGPGTLSAVLAGQAVSQVVFVLFGGVLADRFPRGRVLAGAEGVAGLAWGGLAVLVATGRPGLVPLMACAILAGLAAAPVGPALTGLVPITVPPDRLRSANSTLRAVTHGFRLLGLGAAGPAVVWLGPGWALALDASSYLIAAGLLAAVRCAGPPGMAGSVRHDLVAGWREFAGRQWLWVLVAAYSCTYAVTGAFTGVLGPMVAGEHLGGPVGWTAVLAAFATGTVGGALGARWVRPRRPGVTAAVLLAVPAAPMALLACAAPAVLVGVGAVVAGGAAGVVSVVAATVTQQHVPPTKLSRVAAYDGLGSLLMAPLALAAVGPAAEAFGPRPVLVLAAGTTLAVAALAVLAPQVRGLRESARPAPT